MKITTLKFPGFVLVMLTVLLCSLLGGPPDARADLVLFNGSIENSFVDLGAQGFGNAPRLLTLQATGNATNEGGQLVLSAGGVPSSATFAGRNDVVNPQPNSNKNSIPTLGSLGWTSGADVKLGFNTGEAGTGITLQQLVLSLYNNSNTVIDTFPLASPVTFTAEQLNLQQGNGNAIFQFVLDTTEQADFTSWLVDNFSTFHIALASEILDSTDGPESFLAVQGPGAPPPRVDSERAAFALEVHALFGHVRLDRNVLGFGEPHHLRCMKERVAVFL